MNEETRGAALWALTGMRQIVENEMLVRGEYVTQIIDRAKSKSVCGGHRFCAIGSLWAGAGYKPRSLPGRGFWLDGAMEEVPFSVAGDIQRREDFLSTRPGLKLALNALDEEAYSFSIKNDIPITKLRESGDFTSQIEALFEGERDEYSEDDEAYYLTRNDFLEIIDNAIGRITELVA